MIFMPFQIIMEEYLEDIKDFTDSLQEFKKSKITFDKGGIWKPISPPLKDS